MGRGSIAAGDGHSSIHLHSSIGRGKEVPTGCTRRKGKAFLVVEAMALEMPDVHATMCLDKTSGQELPSVE